MFYREWGLVFSGTVNGQRSLIIPNELIPVFRDLDQDIHLHKNIKRNTQWIRITQGLLYYYGSLEVNKLLEMVGQYTEEIESTEYGDFFCVLSNAKNYYDEIRQGQMNYSNSRVFDQEKILEEHRKRPDLDFYPFSYSELNKAGVEGFVDKNFAFNSFTKFMMDNYDIALEEAEGLVEECVYAIKLGEPQQNLIEFLQHHLEIDSMQLLQEFMQQIVFLHNNTRQWIIKDHTPNEVANKERKYLQPLPDTRLKLVSKDEKKEKVGRNDPCPCGSNKKYKKCCGKK